MNQRAGQRTRLGRWEPLTVGIDIGGTKVLAGVVDSDGPDPGARSAAPTPGRASAGVEDTIVELVDELRRGHDVVAVGIGAAGFVDADRATCCSRRTWPGATSRCGTR